MRTRERHQVYKKVLAECEQRRQHSKYYFIFGFCYAFKFILGYERFHTLRLEQFPEIWKHKPKRLKDAYWWSLTKRGDNKRIAILRQAVEETKPKAK